MSINTLSSIQSIVKKSKITTPPILPIVQYKFNSDLTNFGTAGATYNGINNNLTFTTVNPSPSTVVSNYSIQSSNGGTSNYQYFKIPAMNAIITTANGVSVSFWYSPRGNTSGDGGFACFGAGSLGTQYASLGGTPVTTLRCYTVGSQMEIGLAFAPAVNTSSRFTYNTWHHLALVMDIIGATPKYSLYIDNVNIASNIAYPSGDGNNYYPTFTDFWTIGAIIKSHGWGQFLGAIADFRIYNLKLTSANVSSIYNNLL